MIVTLTWIAANFTMSFQLRLEAVFSRRINSFNGCYREITTHAARTCNDRRVCKVCQWKHPSGLHCYKMKIKKPSVDDKDKIGQQPGAMKSNCAGIKNVATIVGEVIRMCVVLTV